MVRVTYNDDSEKLGAAIRRAPKFLEQELAVALERHALFFEGQVLGAFNRGGRSGPFKRNPTRKLGIVSGNLSRSMRHKVIRGSKLSGLKLDATIGNASTPQARIVHDGGTIRARPGKKLAVPLPDNITPAGRTRFTNLRSVQGTFITTSKAGNLVIGRKVGTGKGAKVEWLAILKDFVKIPPRPYYINVFNSKKVRQDGERELSRAAGRALVRAAKSKGGR